MDDAGPAMLFLRAKDNQIDFLCALSLSAIFIPLQNKVCN